MDVALKVSCRHARALRLHHRHHLRHTFSHRRLSTISNLNDKAASSEPQPQPQSQSQSQSQSQRQQTPNVDPQEISKFAALAHSWWHPNGSAAPLHRLNPLRVSYIRSAIQNHVQLPPHRREHVPSWLARFPLSAYDILDVGCGAGLVTEPLTRLGANVTGIDMSEQSIKVARAHARTDPMLSNNDRLNYRVSTVEAMSDTYDAVLALEIIEHVPDPVAFLTHLASVVRPGGILVLSTINRTVASYALAIIAAERIVRWLPPNTHDWNRFVQPQQIKSDLERLTDLRVRDVAGVAYNPFSASFSLVENTSVNYMLVAYKEESSDAESSDHVK